MVETTKVCKKCKNEIKKDARKCPYCGSKQGVPLIIPVLLIIFIYIMIFGSGDEDEKPVTEKVKEVQVISFVDMGEDEINAWCDENKVICVFKKEYSDTVAKEEFIDQNFKENEKIERGEAIILTYSLGKEPSTEFKNALKKAESYSNNLYMSKEGIYQQLISEYGEGFPKDAAKYAIDNLEADWNENALKKAQSYQKNLSMSKSKIYDQLISEYGEKFTKEQAQYAIDHLDD